MELDTTNITKKFDKIHIVGNPPFGRQSSMAKRFIKKSASFADTISFILPKSFKKESFKNSFPKNFHLVYQIDLPDNSFVLNNTEYDVPCIFQIWKKSKKERKTLKKIKPIGYTFTKKNKRPDISVRRIGVNAGRVSKDTKKSETSHYFLKLDEKKNVNRIIEATSKKIFNHDNTVGPRSISKPELIQVYNPIFNKIK